MTEGNGQPIVYKVDYSTALKDRIKALHLQASSKGKGHQFIDALRAILTRLRDNPKDFGERLYRLPALKLVIYHAVIAPIAVDYGVHEEKALVFIRGIHVLGGG
jgi:hypothetical protein